MAEIECKIINVKEINLIKKLPQQWPDNCWQLENMHETVESANVLYLAL